VTNPQSGSDADLDEEESEEQLPKRKLKKD
jgi:hypothetical protein